MRLRIRSVLLAALRHAERRGLVIRNAAALSVLPRCRPPAKRRSLAVEEGRDLLEAARGDRLEALVWTGIMTGLRPGELTGLLWTDLDLDNAKLTVSGSLKRERGELRRGEVKRSRASRRTIDLAPSLVHSLTQHRARHATERLAAGPAWVDDGLVFSTALGGALDPSNVRRLFRRLAKDAGLERSFPYELRHTLTSDLIDAGKSLEEVADLLGNDPGTLYRHYRHRVRRSVDVAAGPSEQLFGRAREADAT